MSADFRDQVRAAAPRPSAAPDVDAMWRRGKRMRAARRRAAVLLVAVLGIGAWAVARSEFAADLVDTNRPNVIGPARLWDDYSTGWTELPTPPEVRAGAASVWTGAELLVWGGCEPEVEDDCVPTADGFAFDPRARTWRTLPRAPLAESPAGAAWTGEEAVFLVGGDQPRVRGQAFNPATGAWRTIAPAPLAPRLGGVDVWTGSELIVWGGGSPGSPSTMSGAAYHPGSDSWRPIPDAPIGLNSASGMWTGGEMLVFGSLLDGRNIADTPTSVGAAFDPSTNQWREMATSQLSPQATSAVWAGGRMVAWDYEVRSQEYDPVTNEWTDPLRMPLEFSECYPESAEVDGVVFAFFCGRAALYDAAADDWDEIQGGPLEAEIRTGSGPQKLWRFAELVPTDEVVLLAMEGITVDKGEVCYGCPGSPAALWAYRLPAG
jgi:hypothetical protein